MWSGERSNEKIAFLRKKCNLEKRGRQRERFSISQRERRFEPISLEPRDIFINLFEARGGLCLAASLMKRGEREEKGGTRGNRAKRGEGERVEKKKNRPRDRY